MSLSWKTDLNVTENAGKTYVHSSPEKSMGFEAGADQGMKTDSSFLSQIFLDKVCKPWVGFLIFRGDQLYLIDRSDMTVV